MVYPLGFDELLHVFLSRHSVQQRRITSCVALAPLGALNQELGQKRLVWVYWGLVP